MCGHVLGAAWESNSIDVVVGERPREEIQPVLWSACVLRPWKIKCRLLKIIEQLNSEDQTVVCHVYNTYILRIAHLLERLESSKARTHQPSP